MYVPGHFRVTDQTIIKEFIQQNHFATLVSYDGKRPVATHTLLDVEHDDDGTLLLNGHMSKANPQWRTLDEASAVLAIFAGPHTYISPRWYDHTNVPTWNYMSVHVYGTPRLITERSELLSLLKKLVDRYEATSGATPVYQMESLPEAFVDKELRGLVGFQIRATQIDASFKLSQNRNQRDYETIIDELSKREDDNSLAIAAAMQTYRRAK